MAMANDQYVITKNIYIDFRKVIKFLDSPEPGMYRQKAVDLRQPPSLPKHILLHRARGIEEVETEEEQEDEAIEEEMEEDEASKLNKAVGKFGDTE